MSRDRYVNDDGTVFETVSHETFKGEVIELSTRDFFDCTFIECYFVGAIDASFEYCVLKGCDFMFNRDRSVSFAHCKLSLWNDDVDEVY